MQKNINSFNEHKMDAPIPSPSVTKIVAYANGKPITSDKLQKIQLDEFDGFDVVLNMPGGELLARENPHDHTTLRKCSCKNIGNFRMRLLAYMLKHPNARICADNIYKVYGPDISMTSNTLAKAISFFRKALKSKDRHISYILTELAWGESRSKTGHVYVLNLKWHYLVIRNNE